MCFVATVANRIKVLQYYANEINFSLYTVVWLWFIVIPDLFVLLILYILLFHIRWKCPQLYQCCILFGYSLAVFILLISTGNILMLTITGIFSSFALNYFPSSCVHGNGHFCWWQYEKTLRFSYLFVFTNLLLYRWKILKEI